VTAGAGTGWSGSRETDSAEAERVPRLRPRLGFLGVGWIGRHRMEAVAQSGVAEIVAIADPSPRMREEARGTARGAEILDSFESLLGQALDGVVIASPSALHAEQSIAALERGFAVFCQKPLGRTAQETGAVVSTARRMNRLLGVDLSYRQARAFRAVRDLVVANGIGRVYAVDLVFHNAYGPDKPWFYDPRLSGGGCVMDLGIHLVDLALWVLGFPRVEEVSSRLFSRGEPLRAADRVEDFATARLDLESGTTVQLACSWNLPAGQDAVISVAFYGTAGGAAVRNVGGSFYDFVAERYEGTARQTLVEPPDAWGGRAAVRWAERLAAGERFDAACNDLVTVARVLDRIYGR
jgi:predicted dehydrogenase